MYFFATVYTNAPKWHREAILADLCTLLRHRPSGDAHVAGAMTQPPTHTSSRSLTKRFLAPLPPSSAGTIRLSVTIPKRASAAFMGVLTVTFLYAREVEEDIYVIPIRSLAP